MLQHSFKEPNIEHLQVGEIEFADRVYEALDLAGAQFIDDVHVTLPLRICQGWDSSDGH